MNTEVVFGMLVISKMSVGKNDCSVNGPEKLMMWQDWIMYPDSKKMIHIPLKDVCWGLAWFKYGKHFTVILILDFLIHLTFEYAINTGTRDLAHKLSIPLCRKDVKKRSFAVRCVNNWNSIPAEAVVSKNLEAIKAQIDRFLGDRL